MAGPAVFYDQAVAEGGVTQPLMQGQPNALDGKKKEPKKQKGKTAVKWILLWTFILTCVWGPLVFGPAWHEKRFFGFGITTLDIRIGLMHIDWDVDCTSYFRESVADSRGRIFGGRMKLRTPESEFCRFLKLFQGRHSLRHARELACATRENFQNLPFRLDIGCEVFYRVYMAATFMMLGAGLAVLFHLVAFILLYYYWYVYAHYKLRISALTLYFLGPLSGAVGLFSYTLIGGDLGDIFKPMFSTLPFEPIREHEGISWGYCWVCAGVLTFFQLWLPLFFLCFVRVKKEEKMISNHNEYEEQVKFLLNDTECNAIMSEAIALNEKVVAHQQQQQQAFQGYASSPPGSAGYAGAPGPAPGPAPGGGVYSGGPSQGPYGASQQGPYAGQPGAAQMGSPAAYY